MMLSLCCSFFGGEEGDEEEVRERQKLRDSEKERQCIFCEIVRKRGHNHSGGVDHHEPDRILLESENCVAFEDIRPQALQHFLVIPKEHIREAFELTPTHIPLLEEMKTLGQQLVEQQRHGLDDNTEVSVKFGFHIPPFNSVLHLHLHCLVGQTSAKGKISYREGMPWFKLIDDAVADLEKRGRVTRRS
eukprot:TRINITY_DN2981_c0_g1_i1.p1 TRINITY_DN2981_c0_g1~~TRINITY_DN2981_c0_g1_i1.p1  ORF type:complete len:189 (-),score=41.68 TRINITY_DN2981_c0_g1_i1:267-833(-)